MVVIPIRKDEKEVIQAQLDNEKAVLKQLEQSYKDALTEIEGKIAQLLGRSDADMAHVVYQVEFQKSLKKQIQGILLQLQTEKFETVSEYLTTCYNEGFLGTLYSLQKQGVPLAIPINQEEVAAAIQLETKLSTSLYEAFDMKDLQKKIASEISRGFSTGAMYSEIARNVASYARIDKNKATRIVRTEGHRITEAAAYNAQIKAKERGADIVRIWDAFFDAKTRPSHMRVDGEIRELEEKFSNGLKYPGDPNGAAAEVVNCRCRSRTDARWALDAESTKMLGDVSEMSDKRKQEIADKLGIPVEDLEQYSGQIVPVNAKSYSDFKRQYNELWHYEGSDLQKEAEERIKSYGKKAQTSKKPLDNSANSSTIKSLDIDDFETMASTKDITPEVTGVIGKTIKDFESKGGMYISEAHFGDFYDPITGFPALFQVVVNPYGLTEININSRILGGMTVDEINEIIAKTKSNLPQNLTEAVVHECGHAKAYYGKTAKQVAEMNEELLTKGVDGISKAASLDGAEVIAEVEVLLHRGAEVPEEAMKLYNEYVKGNAK